MPPTFPIPVPGTPVFPLPLPGGSSPGRPPRVSLAEHVEDHGDPHGTLKLAKQVRIVWTVPDDLTGLNDGDLVVETSTGALYGVVKTNERAGIDRLDLLFVGRKADKVAGATAGSLAALDASGNLLDSGETPESIVRSAVEAVVANAPAAMDTLKEIADIIGSASGAGTVLKRILDLETGKADSSSLAAVATSGRYEDLVGKPAIPRPVTVDSAFSLGSVNPVENRVVKAGLDGKVAKSGDTMTGGLVVPDLTVGGRAAGSVVGSRSVAEGRDTVASGTGSHAEGRETAATGEYSHAEGTDTEASGDYSHAEGQGTAASGELSHAEGDFATASGIVSHAEGSYTTASGDYSHAEGDNATASDDAAHAEGCYTAASGVGSHAEGNGAAASGDYSHAEGMGTAAGSHSSHAEGFFAAASGYYSHAEGNRTTAQNESEHAQGRYNASHAVAGSSFGDPGNTLSSVGFGTADDARRNAVETMQDGKTFVYGAGGYDGTNPTGAGVKDVATVMNAKQDALSDAQLAAANSGATAAKVSTWDGYAAQIAQKANASDLPYALVTPGEWDVITNETQLQFLDCIWDTEVSMWVLSLADAPEGYYRSGTPEDLTVSFDVWGDSVVVGRPSLPGQLLDRAGNRVEVTGDTTLTLPAAVPGYIRDFLVRLTISGSTVPTITFAAPTGETITYETDGDEFPVPDAEGTWLYSFTETTAHTFAVSLKSVSTVTQGGS